MPTLISSDVSGYLRRLGQVKGNDRRALGAEEKLVIIWGMIRGWSKAKTARMIGRSTSPIGRYKNRIVHNPQIVFDHLQLYSQLADRKWGCRICGEFRNTRMRVMRHILAHILPIEIAKGAALSGQNPPYT